MILQSSCLPVNIPVQFASVSRADIRLLREWLATKPNLKPDDLLFPIAGRTPGGTDRKTHKMMQRDLQAARRHRIADGNP